MTHRDAGNYRKKHPSNAEVDERIVGEIGKRTADGRITCAEASRVADMLRVSMGEVGVAIDLMEIRITACQLGLFGYSPERVIAKPAENVAAGLEIAIREALVNDRLPCTAAWVIAEKLGISRMDVSSACETLKIKVKPCQLGAF